MSHFPEPVGMQVMGYHPPHAIMKCKSCGEEYRTDDAGTCATCYEETIRYKNNTMEELEVQRDQIRSLCFFSSDGSPSPEILFSDIVLIASDDIPIPVPSHKFVLANRSPVFRAMLENEMEETLSGKIKIKDVSYKTLYKFVAYMYMGDVSMSEGMARSLLVLGEKYEMVRLKRYCEDFLKPKITWDNSLDTYVFAIKYNSKYLHFFATAVILKNMDKITARKEYADLVQKDPRLIIEIYEMYLSSLFSAPDGST